MFLAVVAFQPGMTRAWCEPERKIDRNVRIDPRRLHLLDDGDGALDGVWIHFALFVENSAVTTHHVDTVLGKHAPCFAQSRSIFCLLRRPVHGPEPHRLAIGSMNKMAVFHDDESMLTGELLVQKSKV